MRDLREKLSGTMKPQTVNTDPPKKQKLEVAKATRKSDSGEARPSTTQKVAASPATRKKAAQKARNFYLFFYHFLLFVFWSLEIAR